MQLIHHIGRQYHYPLAKRKFKLVQVQGWVYVFECGHRCTDNVFMDLIDAKTGIQVYKNKQLEIF